MRTEHRDAPLLEEIVVVEHHVPHAARQQRRPRPEAHDGHRPGGGDPAVDLGLRAEVRQFLEHRDDHRRAARADGQREPLHRVGQLDQQRLAERPRADTVHRRLHLLVPVLGGSHGGDPARELERSPGSLRFDVESARTGSR